MVREAMKQHFSVDFLEGKRIQDFDELLIFCKQRTGKA
jgi:hypothetical protein